MLTDTIRQIKEKIERLDPALKGLTAKEIRIFYKSPKSAANVALQDHANVRESRLPRDGLVKEMMLVEVVSHFGGQF